jgi:hypothetical protein
MIFKLLYAFLFLKVSNASIALCVDNAKPFYDSQSYKGMLDDLGIWRHDVFEIKHCETRAKNYTHRVYFRTGSTVSPCLGQMLEYFDLMNCESDSWTTYAAYITLASVTNVVISNWEDKLFGDIHSINRCKAPGDMLLTNGIIGYVPDEFYSLKMFHRHEKYAFGIRECYLTRKNYYDVLFPKTLAHIIDDFYWSVRGRLYHAYFRFKK